MGELWFKKKEEKKVWQEMCRFDEMIKDTIVKNEMLLCACLCVTQCKTNSIYFLRNKHAHKKITELKMTKTDCPKKIVKILFFL